MNVKRIVVLLALFVFGFATFAFADSIDQRVRHAHERIERGIQSGQLNRNEAHSLKRQFHQIREDEARMRADGRLSHHERERLHRELDHLERRISHLKHNENRRDGYRHNDGYRHHNR